MRKSLWVLWMAIAAVIVCTGCKNAADASSLPEATLPPLPTADVSGAEAPTAPSSAGSTAPVTRPSAAVTTTTTTAAAAARQTVRVTIPEGWTLTQIFKKLEQEGVCRFDALMETAASYDYRYYPLIAALPDNSRAFRLEGYLYPDTYEFYKNERPQDAIGRFLRVAEQRITEADRNRAQTLGYSTDQILTVASIIEKEGSNPEQVAMIASVIYNRLKQNMRLQMDSGITYIEDRVKPYISGDTNRYNSLYNMYKCSGLPAGPICNPGRTAIRAALYPAESDYLYFCHDKNAGYYYAVTYEEHQENLKKAGLTA